MNEYTKVKHDLHRLNLSVIEDISKISTVVSYEINILDILQATSVKYVMHSDMQLILYILAIHTHKCCKMSNVRYCPKMLARDTLNL